MELHDSESAFLDQLGSSKASWEAAVNNVLQSSTPDLIWSSYPEAWQRIVRIIRESGAEDDFKAITSELLYGAIHSVLAVLDGSSALADKTQLNIQDGSGHQFIHFLNEFWPEHSGDAL